MPYRKYRYYINSAWMLITRFKPRLHILRTFLRPGNSELKIVELPSHGVRFITRNAMDIWTIKETFLDRFYEKYSTPIQDNWNVIDIGAGLGDFSIDTVKRHPHTTVFAYEPYPQSYEILKQNLDLNQISDIKVFPIAVWSDNSNLVINTIAGEPGSYVCQPFNQFNNLTYDNAVKGISLSEVFKLNGINRCNLLKMDCEGSEFPILFNTPNRIFKKIERIILEYHDKDEECNHKRLVEFLQSKEYHVRSYPNFVHARLGYLFAWH